ncbi:hypothetical protein F4779DRAFT_624286 [Xylariaceae sp. FL0662B]|nr:hypothetical protein F4779DRAFT_624286 [Xylariaceae sp. FL0662B]
MAKYLQAGGALAGAPSTRIFEFNNTFIENLTMLPNGRLLLTTFGSGSLYMLKPETTNPAVENLVNLEGSTGLSGIASLGSNNSAVVVDSIPVPGTRMMNGMAALTNKPQIILSADSLGGRILRVDTSTREVSVALTDASLGPSEDNPTHALGINGLRVRNSYLYFTNSAQGTFARFPIDDDGNKIGDIEIIGSLEGDDRISHAYDDFALDSCGNAYVALHPSSVVKITPDGKQTTIARTQTDLTFREPTSVLLAQDSKSIYVSTGGKTIKGKRYGGQIIHADISPEK